MLKCFNKVEASYACLAYKRRTLILRMSNIHTSQGDKSNHYLRLEIQTTRPKEATSDKDFLCNMHNNSGSVLRFYFFLYCNVISQCKIIICRSFRCVERLQQNYLMREFLDKDGVKYTYKIFLHATSIEIFAI